MRHSRPLTLHFISRRTLPRHSSLISLRYYRPRSAQNCRISTRALNVNLIERILQRANPEPSEDWTIPPRLGLVARRYRPVRDCRDCDRASCGRHTCHSFLTKDKVIIATQQSPSAHPNKSVASTNDHTAKMSTGSLESKNTTEKAKVPFIVQYFDPEIRAKDPSGRDLDDVLDYSDNQISRKHDFIQYLFPLPEESMVNPWAPLITKDAYDAFRDREELRKALLQGLKRMLDYYGFTFSTSDSDGGDGSIVPAQHFSEKSKVSWRRSMDHNHLRLTRIIRCFRVLSCEKEAKALYDALLENDTTNVVSRSSKMFWGRAANRPLWLPPDEPDDDAEGIRWLREVDEAQAEGATAERAEAALDGESSDTKIAAAPEASGANHENVEKDDKGKLS